MKYPCCSRWREYVCEVSPFEKIKSPERSIGLTSRPFWNLWQTDINRPADQPADRPSNRPTNQQTGRLGLLPFCFIHYFQLHGRNLGHIVSCCEGFIALFIPSITYIIFFYLLLHEILLKGAWLEVSGRKAVPGRWHWLPCRQNLIHRSLGAKRPLQITFLSNKRVALKVPVAIWSSLFTYLKEYLVSS